MATYFWENYFLVFASRNSHIFEKIHIICFTYNSNVPFASAKFSKYISEISTRSSVQFRFEWMVKVL